MAASFKEVSSSHCNSASAMLLALPGLYSIIAQNFRNLALLCWLDDMLLQEMSQASMISSNSKFMPP